MKIVELRRSARLPTVTRCPTAAPAPSVTAPDPGRVFPGHKMAKHMGMVKQTTQNLRVVSYDAESKLLLIEGAIPGAKSWTVRIAKARKVAGAKGPASKKT